MVYILPQVRRRAFVRRIMVPLLVLLAPATLGAWTSLANARPIVSAKPAGPVVYRWGVVGNRGAINKLEHNTPAVIAGIAGKVVQIATSNSDGYALTSTGQVYGWGVNSYGELGDGRLTPYETRAIKVGFPPDVRATALADPMPFDAAVAIDSTGHAWGWGLNGAGDLCLPGLVESRPQELPLQDVTLATGARTHSLFDSAGAVYACGSGASGELGNGSPGSTDKPTPVVGLPSGVEVVSLTSSWEGSGALLAGGDYYNWGYNAAGQLGDGTTANSGVPVRVALPGPVAQAFQGGSGPKNGQTIVMLSNGSAWAWGSNGRGQLGTGTRTRSLVPVEVHVRRGVRFVSVCSGGFASYAIDQAGRLWAWGDNRHGQLGTGSRSRAEVLPVLVGIHLTQVSSTAQNVAGLEARGGASTR
jgi:alpha-tubulin suppressor-like RCC1 family protein